MVSLEIGRFFHTLLMLAALIASCWIYRRTQQRLEVSNDQKRFLSLAAILGAFIGAKLPFLIESDWGGLRPWMHWLSDGKTVLGGIFGGYLAVEATKVWVGIRQRTGDAFALPIAAGLSIGRIGCFVGGCCYGTPTDLPWGATFQTAPDRGTIFRHPVQLYETLFHSLAILALVTLQRLGWFPGQRLKLYLLSYLIFRFVTEWIRPEEIVFADLTAYQIACLGLGSLLIVQFLAHWKSNSKGRSTPGN
jgi:phosphatidylglycerol:prolipoprotein diacylglycerol transferase